MCLAQIGASDLQSLPCFMRIDVLVTASLINMCDLVHRIVLARTLHAFVEMCEDTAAGSIGKMNVSLTYFCLALACLKSNVPDAKASACVMYRVSRASTCA